MSSNRTQLWRVILATNFVGAALLLIGCGPDSGQVNICQRVLHELVAPTPKVTVLSTAVPDKPKDSVTVVYRWSGDAQGRKRHLTCTFAGSGFNQTRLVLLGVIRDSGEKLSMVTMIVLRHRLKLQQ